MRKTFKHGGLKAIQKGLFPAMMYQVAMNGARLGSFEPFKRTLNATDPHASSSSRTCRTITAGALSGALGATVGSPFFLIKVTLH